ncbi:4-hydroxymandelate oxidase [Erwinia toletana]|uniref:4-hydroxymandelate oxidase n=1 Tax=Winslowiella toletana TaxID=92490 RepID=A0ABS4P8K2_9GAMM|nr:alpha-hydroxy acid oxidase [Winslowiella toletana]MBP2168957.1 4-hydroxymandelate oxidase [Winslowiella toletana]
MHNYAGMLPFQLETRQRLGDALYRYMVGQPADAQLAAADANSQDLQRYRLLPRVMRATKGIDTRVMLGGQRWAAPLGVGAFAGDVIFHPEGLLPIARACKRLQLPLAISEETVTPLAEICDAYQGCWLQLRAAGDLPRIERLIRHAADCQAAGIILTVLAPVHPVAGLQPGGYSIGEALQQQGLRTIGASAPGVETLPAFPGWGWNEIRHISAFAAQLKMPLMLKGILHPEDARQVPESGVDAIIASNIGLRQSARWATPAQQMPQLRQHYPGDIVMDGGIRSGTDVVVAACLGATLSLTVRPVISALVAGGEEAVFNLLAGWVNEITAISHWCGVSAISELNPSFLAAEPLS